MFYQKLCSSPYLLCIEKQTLLVFGRVLIFNYLAPFHNVTNTRILLRNNNRNLKLRIPKRFSKPWARAWPRASIPWEGNEAAIIAILGGQKKFLLHDTSTQFLSLPREIRNVAYNIDESS